MFGKTYRILLKTSLFSVFTLSWELSNLGVYMASGYKCDSVYLSEDDQWDITDVEVKSICSSIAIQDSGVEYFQVASNVPYVVDTALYGIVRSRTNIRDLHLENNIGVSTNTLLVTYPELTFDIQKRHTITDSSAFVIKDVPLGKTLVISITSSDGLHDIYIKYQKPPSGYDFDASSKFPTGANQQSVVPYTNVGSYYILFENADLLPSDSVILAKLAKFEILSINPKTIAARGPSTLHIEGTLFGEVVNVHLVNGSFEINATKIYRFSSTDIFATFSQPLNQIIYDIKLTNVINNDQTILRNALEVKSLSQGKCVSTIKMPRALRPNQVGVASVHFQNIGYTDATGIFLEVRCFGVGDAQILHDGMAITSYSSKHLILPIPEQGPAGIFRPQANGVLYLGIAPKYNDVVGSVLTQISVVQLSETEENPFSGSEMEFRVNLIHSISHDSRQYLLLIIFQKVYWKRNQWDPVWNNFLSALGPTSNSAAVQLSELSNTLSLVGQSTFVLSRLLDYQLKLCDGQQSG